MQGMDGIFQCIINPLKIFEISHTSKSTMYTGSSSPDSLARSESQERMSYTEAQPPDPITSGHFLGAWKQRCTLGKHDSLSEFPGGSHVFSSYVPKWLRERLISKISVLSHNFYHSQSVVSFRSTGILKLSDMCCCIENSGGGQCWKASFYSLVCLENYHSNGTKLYVMGQKSTHHLFCPGVLRGIYLLTPVNLRSTLVFLFPRHNVRCSA